MRTLPRLAAATAVLAMPLALGACGSSSGSGGGSAQQASASAPGTSAPDGAAEQSGKPSKEDVVQGLVQFYATQGKSGDSATKLAKCIAGKSYTTLSPKTLQAMKDGRPKQIDPADAAPFSKIAGQCAMAGAAG